MGTIKDFHRMITNSIQDESDLIIPPFHDVIIGVGISAAASLIFINTVGEVVAATLGTGCFIASLLIFAYSGVRISYHLANRRVGARRKIRAAEGDI